MPYWLFIGNFSSFCPNGHVRRDVRSCKNEGFRNRRVSSYNPTGENRDRIEAIEPGETIILADIKGAGIINHIWFTMSPGPRQLSRNDIILRMYWDGNDEPSVVSPIGPFFGQGWNEQYNFLQDLKMVLDFVVILPCLLPKVHV